GRRSPFRPCLITFFVLYDAFYRPALPEVPARSGSGNRVGSNKPESDGANCDRCGDSRNRVNQPGAEIALKVLTETRHSQVQRGLHDTPKGRVTNQRLRRFFFHSFVPS